VADRCRGGTAEPAPAPVELRRAPTTATGPAVFVEPPELADGADTGPGPAERAVRHANQQQNRNRPNQGNNQNNNRNQNNQNQNNQGNHNQNNQNNPGRRRRPRQPAQPPAPRS
jgi:hypothetical protein